MAEYGYLNFNIFLMLLGGTLRVQTQSAVKRTLFQSWRFFLNSNIFYVFVAVIVDFTEKGVEQFDLVVLNFLYIFGTLIVLLKANYYYFFDDKSNDILEEMHRFFKYRTETLLEEKDLKESIGLSRKITVVWFVVGMMAAQGFILMFLIINTGSERKLPLPFWFPYNWKISPLYELTILYQFFIHQIMIVVVVGTDMFFATVVLLTSEQFTLLGWEVKHLLYTVLLKSGVSKKIVSSIQALFNSISQEVSQEDWLVIGVLNELLTLQKIKANLLENLKQHVQFHQTLLKFCDCLEGFFSAVYLPYFFIVLIVDVVVSLIITTTTDAMLRLTAGLYMISVTITLILGCSIGQLITVRAEALQQDVFDSPWYICDELFKSHVKYLHLKTCKPIVLTVGKIAPLSLNAFLWIVKTAASYVTILHQLTEDNRKSSS